MRKPLLTDYELVQLYLSGNEYAFEQLMIRHKDKIYSAIYLLVKDEYLAEDFFQETFIKAIHQLRAGKYKDENKFRPWIMRIAHNLCMDYFRKLKRNPGIVTNDGDDIFDHLRFEETSADEHLEVLQSENKLRELIDQLPEQQKEVVMLRHFFDFSFKEIAEFTGVSINTALGRMRYAVLGIRKLIQEKELEMVRLAK